MQPTKNAASARRRLLQVLLAAAPLLSAGVHAASAPPVVQDGSSPAVVAWKHAVETADIDAIERMNPPGATAYTLADEVLKGTRAIAAGYRIMFDRYDASATVDDAHFIRTGDLLISWGLFSLSLQPRDAAGGAVATVIKGRFSDVARLEAGRWVYVVDHASASPKPQ